MTKLNNKPTNDILKECKSIWGDDWELEIRNFTFGGVLNVHQIGGVSCIDFSLDFELYAPHSMTITSGTNNKIQQTLKVLEWGADD